MREEREIKRDGAIPIKNSGRGQRKGDAVLGPFLVDYKDYSNAFTINGDKWSKHAKDSWEDNRKIPCFGISIKDKYEREVKLGLVPWSIVQDYVRLLEKEELDGF